MRKSFVDVETLESLGMPFINSSILFTLTRVSHFGHGEYLSARHGGKQLRVGIKNTFAVEQTAYVELDRVTLDVPHYRKRDPQNLPPRFCFPAHKAGAFGFLFVQANVHTGITSFGFSKKSVGHSSDRL